MPLPLVVQMASWWKTENIRPQEQILISVIISGYCWTVHWDIYHMTVLVEVDRNGAGRGGKWKEQKNVRGIMDWNELLWEVLDFVGLKVIKWKVHLFLEDNAFYLVL